MIHFPLGLWLNLSPDKRRAVLDYVKAKSASLVIDINDLSTTCQVFDDLLSRETERDYEEERRDNDGAGLSRDVI